MFGLKGWHSPIVSACFRSWVTVKFISFGLGRFAIVVPFFANHYRLNKWISYLGADDTIMSPQRLIIPELSPNASSFLGQYGRFNNFLGSYRIQ